MSEWTVIGDKDPGERSPSESTTPASESATPASRGEQRPQRPGRRGNAPEGDAEITQITQQVKDPERVSVYLDGRFWLGMSHMLLAELGLSPKQSLSEARRAEIEAMATEDKAYGWALRRLGDRAYSSSQIREKLQSKGYEPVVCETVIQRLIDRHHLNDAAYAGALTRSHIESGYGARRAEQKLRAAGIAPELIKDTLEECYDQTDEAAEAAEALARSKWRDKKLSRNDQRKALDLLMRRGFSPSAARSAVEREALSRDEEEALMSADRAVEDLKRRYPRETPDKQKQVAYLARRGYGAGAAYKAVDQLSEERASQ